jgi:6-phosphogluconolactonase (cycloisomerase 2 family)
MPRMSLLLCLLLCLQLGHMGTAQAGQANAVRFAYSSNDLDSSLARYSVDPGSGRLRFVDYLPLAKSPPEVVVDPSGRYLLALSQAINRVFVFRIDHQSGALTPAPGSPFEVKGFSPFSIAFHPSGRFFYIALRFSGVGAYAFAPKTGAVTPLPGSPYPGQLRTRAVEITPSGRFIYALNAFSNSISAFGVDPQTGALRVLPGSPYVVGEVGDINYTSFLSPEIPPTAGGTPYHMLLEPQGRFLLVSNLATANISVFRIDPRTGRLTEVDGSPFFAGFTPSSLALHPSGRFVYALRVRDHLIEALKLDPETGRLSRMPGSPYETGGQAPLELVFADQGRRAYVINGESNDVARLDVDIRTGALRVREVVKTRSSPWSFVLVGGKEPLPVCPQIFAALGAKGLGRAVISDLPALQPQMAAGAVSALAIGPKQRLVYAIDRATDLLTALRVDDAGRLQRIVNGQVATGRSPSDVAIDRNGWYVYVTNAGDDTLSVYFIDPDSGRPKPVRGSPFKTGKQPEFISLDPAARYAYVVNTGDDTVSVYRYRSNVTPLVFETVQHGSPFATGKAPMAVEIDPTGRYAYIANAGSNDISAYRIHHQTGALSALPGSPFKAAGRRPQSLASHPDGQWLYVANHDSADISVFRVETMLGALVRVGAPVGLPFKPRRLQWDAGDGRLYVLADDGRKLLGFSVDDDTGVLTYLAEDTLTTPVLDLAITVDH